MGRNKSEFHKYIVKTDGENYCVFCNQKLDKNMSRIPKHFHERCACLPDHIRGIIGHNRHQFNERIGFEDIPQNDSNVSLKSESNDRSNDSDNKCFRIQNSPNDRSHPLSPEVTKQRNANILSAVLCLIKELDYTSLEVVDTTIHCRMEEMDVQ